MSKYIDGINEKNFDTFLAALRSGEFLQGIGSLNREGQLCCLGVASEMASREGAVSRVQSGSSVRYGGQGGTMPHEVDDWLGIPQSHRYDGDIKLLKQPQPGTSPVTAITLNDSWGKNFSEIADALELEFKSDED